MASIRGILNIQSLNELTSENLCSPRPAPPAAMGLNDKTNLKQKKPPLVCRAGVFGAGNSIDSREI